MYCAPSMGSETTPPYAWLLWRFKKTLANPVTWCCRCLYDMLARELQVCSATIPEGLLSAFLLSIMRLKCDLQNKHAHTNKSKWESESERRRKKNVSYVLAKLSLSYPVGQWLTVQNTPCFADRKKERRRRRRRRKKKRPKESIRLLEANNAKSRQVRLY